MRSKRFFSFFPQHRKACVLILFLLIGGLLIYPAAHLIPIMTNIITGKLSKSINPTESVIILDTLTEDEPQSINVFLPLVRVSNQEHEKLLPENQLDSHLNAIDISPTGKRITINMHQKDNVSLSGVQVEISFLPGEQCIFGDGRACMYDFKIPNHNRVILASLHSGIGAEGEIFRDFIEGTGLNHGLYTTDQVNANIDSFISSEILISQGATEITGLVLQKIIRIPSAYIEPYLSLPVDQTIAYAQEITNLNLEVNNQELFVLETCGWRLPDEKHFSEYPNSMQSIYLAIFSFRE